MKKHGLIISVVIQIFLSFWTITYFPQNSYASSNHPYRFFSERRISQFDQFPVTSEAIVFLGDSLVDEGRWEEIFPDQKIFNRGVLADRTEHVLARLDQITQGQPDMIFIMIGTNDLKSGVRQKTIISTYHKILNTIKKQSPRTKIFIQSLLPRKAKFKKQIEQINNELVLLAQKSGYTYIDLYSVFLGSDGSIKKEYSNDDLHLLGAGYLKWKEIILPYINLRK